jgi:hypothetical protein
MADQDNNLGNIVGTTLDISIGLICGLIGSYQLHQIVSNYNRIKKNNSYAGYLKDN